MHSRKGFIQIAEIIIIMVSAFFVVVQLQTLPQLRTDWTAPKLTAFGEDLVAAMEIARVNWTNSSDIFRIANNSFPPERLLQLTLTGPAKSAMTVACLCTPAETASLRQLLAPFSLNGRVITFDVRDIEETSLSATADVTVMFSRRPSQPAPYQDYLKAGKGIVQSTDLTFADMTETERSLFGLEPAAPVAVGGLLSFGDTANATSPFFPMFKYYNFSSPPVPDRTLLSTLEQQVRPRAGAAVVLTDSGGAAAGIAQQAAGRTLWLSSVTPAHQALLRAAILWAAPREQVIIPFPAAVRNPVEISTLTTLSGDLQEVAEVRLSLGVPFQ